MKRKQSMGPEQPIDPQGDPLVQELVADDDEGGGQEETARGKPDLPRGSHAVHSRPLRSAFSPSNHRMLTTPAYILKTMNQNRKPKTPAINSKFHDRSRFVRLVTPPRIPPAIAARMDAYSAIPWA
jgi:hypothetical protein